MNKLSWWGCYDGGWQAAPLVAEAYAYPAKISFGLAERIYRHMRAEGWLKPGDRVVDPFGGIGGCAFHAMLYGMDWTGVELEAKFVDLGNQNLDLWRKRYGPHFPGYGSARLLQGDSRRLAEIVAAADGVVSSPPFQGVTATQDPNFLTLGEQGKRIPSKSNAADYGSTPGQLGALPAGAFEAAVSSPPYSSNTVHDGNGIDPEKLTGNKPGRNSQALTMSGYSAAISSPPYSETRIDGHGDEGASGLRDADGNYLRGHEGWEQRKALGQRYGETNGNLGNLPANDFAAAVSSPPFEGTEASHAANKYADPEKVAAEMAQKYQDGTFRSHAASKEAILKGLLKANEQVYGDADGQLGTENGETFWTSAREIVAQVYSVLQPGGVAAWITGDFVRAKKRVPFGEQWLALCESCGFEPVAWATAWKTDDRGTQLGLLGDDKDLRKSKVSFFRRLANEKNPDAAILNEDVLFVRKPVREA